MPITGGVVVSVNVGGIRQFDYNGRPAESAIWKSPVAGRVAVSGVNLAGDDQADRKAHGGPHKAVYAFAIQDYHWWETELGRELEPAEFGDNLTTRDIDVNGAVIGEHCVCSTRTASRPGRVRRAAPLRPGLDTTREIT